MKERTKSRKGKGRGTELDYEERKMKNKETAEHLQEHPGYFQYVSLAPENRSWFLLCSENGLSSPALLLLHHFKLLKDFLGYGQHSSLLGRGA